jgi:hypothetical protein
LAYIIIIFKCWEYPKNSEKIPKNIKKIPNIPEMAENTEIG